MISTTAYTKSTHSGMGGCVEVCLLSDGTIGVRDSKNISQAPLIFTTIEWHAFLAGVRDSEFDLPDRA